MLLDVSSMPGMKDESELSVRRQRSFRFYGKGRKLKTGSVPALRWFFLDRFKEGSKLFRVFQSVASPPDVSQRIAD